MKLGMQRDVNLQVRKKHELKTTGMKRNLSTSCLNDANKKSHQERFLEKLKKIPYANLTVGVGARHQVVIENIVNVSAGFVLGNTIEINKGELIVSKAKAVVDAFMEVKAPGVGQASFGCFSSAEIDDESPAKVSVLGKPLVNSNILNTNLNNITEEPRLSASFNINMGIVAYGEVGIDVNQFNISRDYLVENWESFSIEQRKALRDFVEEIMKYIPFGDAKKQADKNNE